MKRTLLILSTLALVGCAHRMDVMRVGLETYQSSAVASPARGGKVGAMEMALEDANKKCESMRKTIKVTDQETGWSFPAAGSAKVTFTCI